LRQGGLQGFGFFGVQGFDGCVHGLSPEFERDYCKYWMFVQSFLGAFLRVCREGAAAVFFLA
jgi:hypothetical protein